MKRKSLSLTFPTFVKFLYNGSAQFQEKLLAFLTQVRDKQIAGTPLTYVEAVDYFYPKSENEKKNLNRFTIFATRMRLLRDFGILIFREDKVTLNYDSFSKELQNLDRSARDFIIKPLS